MLDNVLCQAHDARMKFETGMHIVIATRALWCLKPLANVSACPGRADF